MTIQMRETSTRNSQMRDLMFLWRYKRQQSREHARCPAAALLAAYKRAQMEKRPSNDRNMEPQEGGLKELVLRWFTDTQTPLIQHNGNFPDWFQGLATRK